MAHACNNLGYDYALLGEAGQALAYCQRAFDLCRQAKTDPALEAHIHDSLGYAYRCVGDQRQAIASYRRAVRTAQAIGAPHLGAESLSNLGNCHAAAGEVKRPSKPGSRRRASSNSWAIPTPASSAANSAKLATYYPIVRRTIRPWRESLRRTRAYLQSCMDSVPSLACVNVD